jgi:two-component system, OmpR family, sensor histidine kinase MtrB
VSRRPPLGLHARVAFAWALGAGLLVAAVGGSSYGLVRRYLLIERDQVTLRQAISNARVVRESLQTPDPDLNLLLSNLKSEPRSFPLVRYKDTWFGTAVGSDESIPLSLRSQLDRQASGRQRFQEGDEPYVAVGLAIPSINAQYVEVFSERTLQNTLSLLRNSLFVGTLSAIAIGAGLGSWSARRILRPVTRVAQAAEALAGGVLATRLAAESDRELNRLVMSFNKMTDAVQQRIEREARFASDVSHELRTPLGTLSAAAQVLERRRGEMPERAGQAVEVIVSQLKRLSTMVIDLLEIARIDAGVADVNLEESDVVGLTRLVADSLGLPPDVVDASNAAGKARVHLDRRRYEQILRNLVDNADKYAGGVARIRINEQPERFIVSVDDAGPGVSVRERSRIFERFSRGPTSQGTPGTGLGLALAADQANLMHARLDVGVSPEGGARFSLSLPKVTG